MMADRPKHVIQVNNGINNCVFTVFPIVHNAMGMNHFKIIAGVVLPLQEDIK
jgi:hypothetical protein